MRKKLGVGVVGKVVDRIMMKGRPMFQRVGGDGGDGGGG